MKPREFTSCRCGSTIEKGGDTDCSECTRQRYEETWTHRLSPEFNAFKALLYGCLLLLISLPVFAEGVPAIDLDTIAFLESSHNYSAVCDGGKGLGQFCLHEGVVKDWNEAHKRNFNWRLCAFEAVCSEDVASWYTVVRIPELLRFYGLPVSKENVLTAWNMGIGKVRAGKVAKRYIAKYEEASRVS